MKSYQITKALILIALGGLVACNPLKKMSKEASNVKYDVSPNPLEYHNDKVALTITGKIPPEYFHKKAVVEVTPVLKTKNGGEVIKEFDMLTLVGEAADAEGQQIPQASGGSFKLESEVDYKPAMEYSTLEAKIVGKYKSKSMELDMVNIGDGTIITPMLVMADEKPILGKDNFIKVIPKKFEAQINYLINSDYVRPSEMNEQDIKDLKNFIKEGKDKEYVFKGVKISAYASPDGEITLNENLANDRASTARKALDRVFSRAEVKAAGSDGFYELEGKGEDWNGFKEAMQKSDIEDKDLILRVLQMYDDKVKREQEIKNMAKTYTVLAEEILPPLRRSMITVMAEEQARSDEEIQAALKNDPKVLSIEEILYAATLTDDLNEKLSIYNTAKEVYPKDWRGHNNTGYVLLLQNKANEAKAEFEAALEVAPENKIAQNNLGICFKLSGNLAKAKELYNSAEGAGKEVNYNKGIIMIKEADYGSAVSNMSNYNTFNTALAQLLNGGAEKAINTIDASDDKDMAMSYYLKAIAGARTGNKDLCINNLKSALSKDPSLKKKAMKDVEFIDYMEDESFKGLF